MIRLFNLSSLLILLHLLLSCNQAEKGKEDVFVKNKEAREDSLEYANALMSKSQFENKVTAVIETDPVGAGKMEDAADDPAFWFNSSNESESLIFGSNKQGGINSYNLEGKETAFYPVGLINNIDLTSGVVDGEMLTILGGSSRTDNSMELFTVDSSGILTNWAKVKIDQDSLDEVYGFCMYTNPETKDIYAVINGKNGRVYHYNIIDKDSIKLTSEWKVDTQPEGMVVDSQTGMLYLGEEQEGIWQIEIKTDKITRIPNSGQENESIQYDVEGLTIYQSGDSIKWLLASSQGNFSYAVFDIQDDNRYLFSFIIESDKYDGVEETDGIHAVSSGVLATYPAGILLVQDGFNYDADSLRAQNFKLIDFTEILRFTNLR